MPDVHVIFGPPGTGKTTHLLNLLEQTLERVPAASVAFVSFTKKGVEEGTRRAMEKFNLKPSDCRYFRTLHSLCFRELGMSRTDIVAPQHYSVLGEVIGAKLYGSSSPDMFTTEDDKLLQIDNILRNNFEYGKKEWKSVSAKRYRYVVGEYNALKRQCGVYDFTDLLQQYIVRGEPLQATTAFVDEAQDLTPLQWQVVNKLFAKSSTVYVAGDDDQAIYTWAGADTRALLDIRSASKTILDRSYRLPPPILDYALRITDKIDPRNRQAKVVTPGDHSGKIAQVSDWSAVELGEGSNLVLARTNAVLTSCKKWLKRKGVPFLYKGVPGVDPALLEGIAAYEAWQNGGTEEDAKRYGKFFREMNKRLHWSEVVECRKHDLPYIHALYTDKALRKKEPVRLETIHSSKGAEADHVVLALDIPDKVAAHYYAHYEDELRCYYVGATRAKYSLTLKHSREKHSYPVMSTEQ